MTSNHRWRWRPMLQEIRAASPGASLEFSVPLAEADKARRATWRVSRELKAKGISLETSIDKSGGNGQATLYVYLRQHHVD